MKYKKGVMAQGVLMLLTVLVIVAAVVFFIAPERLGLSAKNSAGEDISTGVGACPDSSATVSFSSVNALSKGTAVTTGQTVKVNGGIPTSAATSYAVGAELEILWNASNYVDTITTHTVTCGGGPIEAEVYATDDMTIRMFNTDGNSITDDGGATNQTAIASGGAASIEVKIDGTDKESSGNLVCVLEHTNSTAVDKITLSGLGGVSKTTVPEFYSVSSAGSKAVAYNVPAIVGAQTVSGTMNIQLKSGKTYPSQAVTMTCYSRQAYQDTDGSFEVGVEDSDATVKYEDDWNFVMYVNA